MSEYHLYIIDRSGHINTRIDLLCEDDATALVRSRARVCAGEKFELWQGVQRLHPPRVFQMAEFAA